MVEVFDGCLRFCEELVFWTALVYMSCLDDVHVVWLVGYCCGCLVVLFRSCSHVCCCGGVVMVVAAALVLMPHLLCYRSSVSSVSGARVRLCVFAHVQIMQ